MNNKVFGEVKFNSGWETKITIAYNSEEYEITLRADAYYEKDGITAEQEEAYEDFKRKQAKVMSRIENAVNGLEDGSNFVPTMLLFKRNGDYGLVFNNKWDIEDGLVVCINSELEILSPDQFF